MGFPGPMMVACVKWCNKSETGDTRPVATLTTVQCAVIPSNPSTELQGEADGF